MPIPTPQEPSAPTVHPKEPAPRQPSLPGDIWTQVGKYTWRNERTGRLETRGYPIPDFWSRK